MSEYGNLTNYIPYYVCKEVSDFCPVELTTLGYFPNRGINYFFAIMFVLSGITTMALGMWKKTWSYMAFIAAGSLLEGAGYASRIFLVDNPWNNQAFETQIVAIILAPTLICISIYLTLKHICLSINPTLSRFKPKLYPFIFVPLDVSCLLIQAVGGTLAATAGYTNWDLLQSGNRAIIAGITLQVVVLGFFGAATLDYYLRVRRWLRTPHADPEALALCKDKKFRMFVYAVAGAYSGILIRCIYRIAEMAGGWGNDIMQDEPSFIVLEGFMILIPVVLLASFPPGILFPQMAGRMSIGWIKKGKKGEGTTVTEKSSTNGVGEGQESEQPAGVVDNEQPQVAETKKLEETP